MTQSQAATTSADRGRTTSVAIRRDPGCWTIALDRADKANALSHDLVEALSAAVAEAHEARVPCIVLQGNGRNFSAGFDFGDLDSQSEADLVYRFLRIEMLLQALACSPSLTVALAHGRNFGAGVDLFAACKWRIATPESTFRMPGLAFGLQLGTRRFASIVGRDAARGILEALDTFDAERAQDIGFVTRITAADAWPAIVAEAAATAAKLPEASRAMLYRAFDSDAHDADLADLVHSAATPGLKDRIRRYLAAQATIAPRVEKPA